jgi:hypothetical protein
MGTQRKEKKVDLPPKGDRNADPITNAPGAHPIETGVGAALGGAAAGMAIGAATGPIGAVVGAVAGAVGGGYAGKAVGEMIDPTTDDNWLRDNFASRPYVKKGDTFDTYAPAYRYAGEAESRYGDRAYHDIEKDIHAEYDTTPAAKSMAWDRARPAVQDAYIRICQIRKESAGKPANKPS